MILEMDGLSVQLLRKRIKNLNLRIHRSGEVQVSAPMALPLDLVYRFLHDKREWIDGHRRRLQSKPLEHINSLETGDMVFFWGQRVALIVHEIPKKIHVELDHATLHLFVKSGTSLDQKQIVLNHWYRGQMQQQLPELFQKWEAMIGVHADTYGIKLMKTRWGSCNTHKKRIVLNLRLVQKPLICLEYVIVHELVHLLEASHNKRFYALMENFMPHWKQVKIQLESTC